MTYPEQLETIQWKNKRAEILKRDGHKCQKCSNEKIVSGFDKGLFSRYCRPNNNEIIQIYNFGTSKYKRARIKKIYSKYISETTVIYIKSTKWGKRILALRKFDPDENFIYERYASKIRELRHENGNKSSSESIRILVAQELELKEQRRLEFMDLNKRKGNTEYEWVFMLGLHIHHNYYIQGFSAWEYKNDALITLCESCHEDLHKNQKTPVYNSEMEMLGYYENCRRCHGAGVLPEYSHVQSGICFRCKGVRYEELIS